MCFCVNVIIFLLFLGGKKRKASKQAKLEKPIKKRKIPNNSKHSFGNLSNVCLYHNYFKKSNINILENQIVKNTGSSCNAPKILYLQNGNILEDPYVFIYNFETHVTNTCAHDAFIEVVRNGCENFNGLWNLVQLEKTEDVHDYLNLVHTYVTTGVNDMVYTFVHMFSTDDTTMKVCWNILIAGTV